MNRIKATIKKLPQFIRRFFLWIYDAMPALIFVVLVSLLLFSMFFWDESFLKLIGVLFQCIGILLALYVLKKLRDSLSELTLKQELILYFKSIPKWGKSVTVSVKALIVGSTALKAKGDVWSPDDESLPPEERITRSVRNVIRLREQVSELEKVTENISEDFNNLIQTLDNEKKESIKKAKEDLKNIHLSSWTHSFFSLLYLFIGTIITSYSKEIIDYFQ